jgi:hypothetical protein
VKGRKRTSAISCFYTIAASTPPLWLIGATALPDLAQAYEEREKDPRARDARAEVAVLKTTEDIEIPTKEI